MRFVWITIVVPFCFSVASTSAAQEPSGTDETSRLLERLSRQQQQLEEQQRGLDEQRKVLEELKTIIMRHRPSAPSLSVADSGDESTPGAGAPATCAISEPARMPTVLSASVPEPRELLGPEVVQGTAQEAGAGEQRPNPTQEITGERPEGPALAVGPARLRVGGYLGLTALYRSTNSGGAPGTSFASIPYEEKVQGNVSEARLSAQASRISIRVDAEDPEPVPRYSRLSGYFEMDFNGTTPGAVAVSSSGVGFRLRHAFAEVQYGDKFFLAAGQAFSLMTPAKDQLSMWPSDVEISQAVDTNYLAGTIWDRAPQLRLTWRPSTRVNWAVSLENPEQQLGTGLVTLPDCCSNDIDTQYNTGSDELRVPNLMPDVATRVAFNPITPFHIDVGGVVRVFRHTVHPYTDDFKEVGGGATLNVRFNATGSTRLIGQSAFGSGLGRYVGGLVPDVAFRSDGSISPIGTAAWVGGVEQRVSSSLYLAGYYSGVNADNNFSVDAGGSYIGYGYPGASNSNNRRIQEVTGTAFYQIGRSPDRGSAQLNLQASWLTREPWSRGTGPDSADAFMFFAQVRYNLP